MVKEQVIEWAKRYIDPEFKFREYQLDEIVKVIHRILDSPDLDYQDCLENNKKQNEHITTINAPTGSGKSLILIISAGVLYTYYRKNSYILVSDTYLWKQYDDFLVSHPKLANMFGSIKGQQNPEFVCQVNDENVTKGACRLKGISWVKMSNDNTTDKLGYKCASTCPYLCKRKHSQLTPITIMTYHLWVTATCAENPLNDGSIKTQWKWGERDVTFGDESHNIPSIFGNIYSQVWSWNRIEKLVDLIEFAKGLKADLSALSFLDDRDLDEISATGISNEIDCIVNTYPSREDVYAKFKPYFDFWETNGVNEDPSKIVKSLNRLYDDMGGFMDFGAKMLTYFNAKNEYNNASSMSTNEYALYDLCT